MLYKETVKSGTLDLIKKLMNDNFLKDFYLVGGTALSLKIGHRESIDIDLFNSKEFNSEEIAQKLYSSYNADIVRKKSNYLSGRIGTVDIDLISHQYKSINPIENIEEIRMMSLEDICAMKINAIVNSGQRLKDFIDIYFLLQQFSLDKILSFYTEKYPNTNRTTAKSSLLYHNDIDFSVPIKLSDKKLKWVDVRKAIVNSVFGIESTIERDSLHQRNNSGKRKR